MHAESPVWSIEEIAASNPSRARLLEDAPATESIAVAVVASFRAALEVGIVRMGMEQSGFNPNDLRIILQFHIGEVLSDQFFNANTGYRAEFRRGWQQGLEYNRSIVTRVRTLIANSLLLTFPARLLTHNFDDCGAFVVTHEQVCASLVPEMSKVWFCARLITGDGQVTQLPTGVVGPRLRIDERTTWAAIARDDESAWLDIIGAFIGSGEPYQPKNPLERAKKLQASGEA